MRIYIEKNITEIDKSNSNKTVLEKVAGRAPALSTILCMNRHEHTPSNERYQQELSGSQRTAKGQFDRHPGAVHALVGENGADRSKAR